MPQTPARFLKAAQQAGLAAAQLAAIGSAVVAAEELAGDWAIDLGATLVQRGVLSAEQAEAIDRAAASDSMAVSDASHQLPASEVTLLDVSGSADGHSPSAAATMVDSVAPRSSAPGGAAATADEAERYDYGKVIGAGGVGEIRAVTDRRIGRDVAMKTLHKPEHRAHRLRFEREAQITGQLEHPFIVPVHEAGTDGHGRPYFTMKLVRGRNLHDWLADHAADDADGRMLSDKLENFSRICDAVAYAHSRGVIHRDLKPHNVMIGEFGEVLVMDWGLAAHFGNRQDDAIDHEPAVKLDSEHGTRVLSPQLTADGALIGTPAYMPPEQALGEISLLDARADLYSLGAILYEMLTHTPPFAGTDTLDVLRRVMAGELQPPIERAPDRQIPARLDAVVRKAMSRHPADRHGSVGELQKDVRRISAARLENEMVLSRPIDHSSALAVLSLGRTARLLQMAMNGILGPLGMGIQDGNLLRIIVGSGERGIATRDIYDRMVSYVDDLQQKLADLQTRGWIQSLPGGPPTKWIATDAGRAKSDESRGVLEPYVEQLLGDLSDNESQQLAGLLDRARDSLERHAVMPPPPG